MKNSFKNPIRVLAISSLIAFALISCSDKICPTYMKSFTQVKSIHDHSFEKPMDNGTIPSPYNEKYKEQSKNKLDNSSNISSADNTLSFVRKSSVKMEKF
jgi:hypothetical protein